MNELFFGIYLHNRRGVLANQEDISSAFRLEQSFPNSIKHRRDGQRWEMDKREPSERLPWRINANGGFHSIKRRT